MPRRRLAACLAILVCAVLACGLAGEPSDPVVDGWPIGPPAACDPGDRCPELIDAARRGLDGRDPGHAAVTAASLHDEGAVVDRVNGGRIVEQRSGECCWVARFELEDGSVRAIGVGYPGISRDPMAVDRGP